MHRCDAICAISREEEQLVQDYGIPSWKAPIEREKEVNSNSTHSPFGVEVRNYPLNQLDVVQIQGWIQVPTVGSVDVPPAFWLHPGDQPASSGG